MSDDRELLELAAKAAGITIECDADKAVVFTSHYSGGFSVLNDHGGSSLWNPLTDDGDALRLAVKLGMGLVVCNDTHRSAANVDEGDYEVEGHDTDPNAATRRAITRAAAEIGRSM